jgi:TRAP-type mannitol/chloroaromatic compound transport system permease large subunit
MSDTQIGMVGLFAVITLIALRLPIGITLIAVSYLGIWASGGHQAAWGMLSVMPHTLIASWTLSAVPMFLLMGFICYHGKLTNGLFDAAKLWFQRLPGGPSRARAWPALQRWARSRCPRWSATNTT